MRCRCLTIGYLIPLLTRAAASLAGDAIGAATVDRRAVLDERAWDYEQPLEVIANATLRRRTNLSSKPVIAHFLVGTVSYCACLVRVSITDRADTQADWANDMRIAMASGIEAFALDVGTNPIVPGLLAEAYAAAQQVGFSCFISFDFAASPEFATNSSTLIVPWLNQYANHPNAARFNGGALVSSFIGDGFNWAPVRAAVNTSLFIIPNYQVSAIAAMKANVAQAYGNFSSCSVDGLCATRPCSSANSPASLGMPGRCKPMAPASTARSRPRSTSSTSARSPASRT